MSGLIGFRFSVVFQPVQIKYDYSRFIQDLAMLVVDDKISIPLTELEFTFARSPGPGGQNVNKVNSKASMKWAVEKSSILEGGVKERFLKKNANRISKEGFLLISSYRYRDQGRNVADCLEKLRQLVLDAIPEPVKRKPAKISRAAKKRRLDSKRHVSEKKQGRSNRFAE